MIFSILLAVLTGVCLLSGGAGTVLRVARKHQSRPYVRDPVRPKPPESFFHMATPAPFMHDKVRKPPPGSVRVQAARKAPPCGKTAVGLHDWAKPKELGSGFTTWKCWACLTEVTCGPGRSPVPPRAKQDTWGSSPNALAVYAGVLSVDEAREIRQLVTPPRTMTERR